MACTSRPRYTRTEDASAARESAPLLRPGAQLIGLWLERVRQRRALGELDDRLLDDIGTTRAAAAREAEKPFWRGGARHLRRPMPAPGRPLVRFPLWEP